jgi:hypothetical protein
LEPNQFEELSNLVVDKKFMPGEKIFVSGKKTDAALYLVRDGSVALSGGRKDVIKPGAYFGEDLLLLDTKQTQVAGKRAPTRTVPDYTAIAQEECLCGILTLSDCRTIFDTTEMVSPELSTPAPDTCPEDANLETELAAAAPIVESRPSLTRELTQQWLKSMSKGALRSAVSENVKLDQLEKHNILGEGQFGEVWLVSADVPGNFGRQHFALKIQKKEDPTRGDSTVAIKREIDVLRLMDHPYIVNLVHYYEDPENVHILMGLVHGGELFDVIHTENDDGTWSSGIPECDAKFYAMVVADTLDYIHRQQFVYRDLKPENVLIDKDGYPIICDFGFGKFEIDQRTLT